MIPVELELENFLAYRQPGSLCFEGIHIACLAGPNGAGKSSLLDAITWALWGRARASQPDELIHQGEQNMRVALTFDQAGTRYRVIRQRKGGKRGASLLELQAWEPAAASWRGMSEATLRATQQKLEDLLRLDFDTFINSAFLMQGRADEFTTKTPNQRKQVLANILGLASWEAYEARAKERIIQTRADMHRVEGRLEEIERELARREAHTAELAAAEAAAALAAQALTAAEAQWAGVEQLRHELVLLQRQIDDLTRRIGATERDVAEAERDRTAALARADRAALQAELDRVRQALAALEPLQAHQGALGEAVAALAGEVARLRGVNQALGPQTEPLKARAAALEAASEPICPTCGQALTDDHRRRLLDELHQDIDQRREAYRANQARVRELEVEVRQRETERAELEARLKERAGLEKRGGELEAALAHADEAARQAAGLQAKLERWQAQLQADRLQRRQVEEQADACEARLRSAAVSQEEVDRLRLGKRLADERVGAARQQLAALDSFARQQAERREERDRLTHDLASYDELREAFSKRGVPAMIIETVVPELERSANELLARMTDGGMHVRIETQRETKTGELREALDILIADELGTRPYELYSGGEAFRVNFAIRIALSRLLARRAGAQLRSLFIDEGFGTQDARGREHLVSAINSIQDDFDRILVITHIDELKDAFPARIEVTKTPQGSQFRLT